MNEDFDGVSGVLRLLGLPHTLLSPLVAHAEAVSEASARLGLLSDGDEEVVLRRHTADSLLFALAERPKAGASWIDVGSGAGFPGIPLALCYAQTRFTLLEANQKKAGFLELMVLDLGLRNVEVIPRRRESVKQRFDVAVARAVEDPPEMIVKLLEMVGEAGVAIVAGTNPPMGAREFCAEVSGVDSPGRLFIMSKVTVE